MIKYIDLGISSKEYEEEISPLIKKIFLTGQFISDSYVKEFENKFKNYCNTKYAIALNSGTDALIFALMSLEISQDDEVITVSNSFIATANAISYLKANPVFVDINDNLLIDYNKIEELITPKTKAIIPVHLMGAVCDMDEINKIAKKHKLFVIEDAAQSIGSTYKGIKTGSLSDIACFSLHPLKNLSGITDGGIITTNNKQLASYIKKIRNHGLKNRDSQEFIGRVSRLNSINAAILSHRFNKLDNIIENRIKRAHLYNNLLEKIKEVKTIEMKDSIKHTYHTYVIKTGKREQLQDFLLNKGIETKIHYPISIHNQKPFSHINNQHLIKTKRFEKSILTLPIANITFDEVRYICKCINEFYKGL